MPNPAAKPVIIKWGTEYFVAHDASGERLGKFETLKDGVLAISPHVTVLTPRPGTFIAKTKHGTEFVAAWVSGEPIGTFKTFAAAMAATSNIY